MSSKRSTNTSTKRLIKSTQAGIKKVSRGNKAAEGFLTVLLFVAILGFFAWQNGYLDNLLGKLGFDWLQQTDYAQTTVAVGDVRLDEIDTDWSVESAPDYYTVLGAANIDFDAPFGEIVYTGLDSLGRTQRVYGCLTHQMWADSAGWRQDCPASADAVSGWGHNEKVELFNADGSSTNGYLFNRSHLIGDSLGGGAFIENIVTGTRQQNVGNSDAKGGMRFTETLAEGYLSSNEDGYVLYSATPIYRGDELVPRAVYVQIYSDDGSIDMSVLVYNASYGYEINYADGTFEYVGF